ncbi:MAG: glycoside hydrolase [Limnochordia bacterium]|jgi:hypothetical protein|nr:glycoside hydrolase [Limnochordia bacterium]MDD4518095.1 sialidase family protein [Limnochordia bacterium]
MFNTRFIDLDEDVKRQVVVDREPGQYLGHPTTVLLEDQRTILTVYPKGHGKGPIILKKSNDTGLTWSERLPVPESFKTSKETPTIHRVIDANGTRRLILFSGLYPIRMAVSEDDGVTWSELTPIGDFGGIVAMASVIPLLTGKGHYAAFFHDDGRYLHNAGKWAGFQVFMCTSEDGGLSWSEPIAVAELPDAHLCEPGAVRSPDGKQIALLLRENSKQYHSFVVFSNDEGATWSEPRQVSLALTGDRHVARYALDGRLVVTFRDTAKDSPTWGDWIAWVGTYDDLVHGGDGQYRVRLKDNKYDGDCAYPGLELLPDGTFVTVTYGHWIEGEEPYILAVRFRLEELDVLARKTI